jgi:hypothetical protein
MRATMLWWGIIGCWHAAVDDIMYRRTLEAHEWRAGDGSGRCIRHSEALNATIGHIIFRLYTDLDSVLVQPPSGALFSDRFRGLYLYVLYGGADISFDSRVENKSEEEIKEERLFLEELLVGMDDGVSLLAMLVAVTLGADVGQREIGALIAGSGSRKKKAHTEMLKLLSSYLSREEEPYVVDGRVDISRFLTSKFFLMQALISNYVLPEDTRMLYDQVYEMVSSYPGIVERYYTTEENDTEYERLMKEHRWRFFDRGSFLPKLDPRTVQEGCKYHSSHRTVGFSDSEECPILSLLCCMLYDPTHRGFVTMHLPRPRECLAEFFERHSEPFEYSKEIEREWRTVLDSVEDEHIVYSGTGGGEERYAADVVNVLRVVCDLCGVDAGILGDLNASGTGDSAGQRGFVALLRHVIDEVTFVGSNEVSEVYEAIAVLMSPEKSLINSISNGARLFLFEMFVPLSMEGEHTRVRVTCGGGRTRFVVTSRTCSTASKIGTGNITDFLLETYLRHYHNERHRFIGRREYRYLFLRLYDRDVCERYLEMCLDEMVGADERQLHPRLWDIWRQVVGRRKGIVKRCMDGLRYLIWPVRPATEESAVRRAFRLCVQGREVRDIDPKELASRGCANMLSYVVRNGDLRKTSDECIVEILNLFISRNRGEMVEYIDRHLLAERDREGILRKAFLDWAHSYISGACRVWYDRCVGRYEMEPEDVVSLHKYAVLLKDYCSVEVLRGEAGMRAVQRQYEHFFREASDVANDLSLIVVVRNTWEELEDVGMLHGYVRAFIERDEAYEFVCRLLQELLIECVYLPRELWLRMQELYRERQAGETDRAKWGRLNLILKGLCDIEHDGLSVEPGDSIEFLIRKNPRNKTAGSGDVHCRWVGLKLF